MFAKSDLLSSLEVVTDGGVITPFVPVIQMSDSDCLKLTLDFSSLCMSISPNALLSDALSILQNEHERILARDEHREIREGLDVYVSLMYGLRKPPLLQPDKKFELFTLMEDLVQKQPSSPRVVLVQGAAGTGKSLFGWRKMQFYDQLSSADRVMARIPIVINTRTRL